MCVGWLKRFRVPSIIGVQFVDIKVLERPLKDFGRPISSEHVNKMLSEMLIENDSSPAKYCKTFVDNKVLKRPF